MCRKEGWGECSVNGGDRERFLSKLSPTVSWKPYVKKPVVKFSGDFLGCTGDLNQIKFAITMLWRKCLTVVGKLGDKVMTSVRWQLACCLHDIYGPMPSEVLGFLLHPNLFIGTLRGFTDSQQRKQIRCALAGCVQRETRWLLNLQNMTFCEIQCA